MVLYWNALLILAFYFLTLPALTLMFSVFNLYFFAVGDIFCVIYRSFSMSLVKPQMRGLLAKRLRFHLPLAFGLAVFVAAAFKVS